MPLASLILHLTSQFLIPPSFTTVPSPTPSCHVYQSPALSQGDCGACSAFALATAASMHLCLRAGVDRMPSPFRIFDCAGLQCDGNEGLSLGAARSLLLQGVGDVRDSPHAFGLPCVRDANGSVAVAANWFQREADIKALLFLTGLPLVGVVGGLMADDAGIHHRMPSRTKHALVVLGWGEDHWIVQNSWGEHWGDGEGRGRISIDALNEAMELTGIIRMIRLCGMVATTGSLVVMVLAVGWLELRSGF